MQNGLHAAIIPFDGYARPIRFSHSATVGLIVSPTNTVAGLEVSGLLAGHFYVSLRFIAVGSLIERISPHGVGFTTAALAVMPLVTQRNSENLKGMLYPSRNQFLLCDFRYARRAAALIITEREGR